MALAKVMNDCDTATKSVRCSSHADGVLQRLQGHKELFDIVLIAGEDGKRISAHRLILIGSSDYFCAMFNGSMRESREKEVTLVGVNGEILEDIINFCYTGCLELREDTTKALLATAVLLQFTEVVEACCEFIEERLKPSNCLGIVALAEQHNLEKLLKSSRKVICEHFLEVFKEAQFLMLNIKQVKELLDSDDIVVPSEEDIFHAAIKWIDHDPKERSKYWEEDLLKAIRLPLLNPPFLFENILPICKKIESKDLLLDAWKCSLSPKNTYSQNRQGTVKLLMAIYSEKLSLQCYCPLQNKWYTRYTPLPSRSSSGIVVLDENLIVLGGESYEHASSTVFSLNLRTMDLKQLASMNTDRCDHCVAVVNNSIYVIGGTDGYSDFTSVERWDSQSNSWSYVASMEFPRSQAQAAVHNGFIYVVGGLQDGETVECYNTNNDTWSTKASMHFRRSGHALYVHKDCLYVIGGFSNGLLNNNNIIDRYDIRTDKWTQFASPRISPGWTKCVSLGSHLFILNASVFYKISKENLETTDYENLRSPGTMTGTLLGLVTVPLIPSLAGVER